MASEWRQAAWALISRGASMIEYWHWHTLHFGAETYWGGILPHNGRPGRVYRELATLDAAMFAAVSATLLRPLPFTAGPLAAALGVYQMGIYLGGAAALLIGGAVNGLPGGWGGAFGLATAASALAGTFENPLALVGASAGGIASLLAAAGAIEMTPIRPKKSDIEVKFIALAWAPHWQQGAALTPAWG